MKILISIFLVILLITFFVIMSVKPVNNQLTRSLSPTPKKEPLVVKGSIPYWDQDNAFESFQKNVQSFNYVNLFWYFLTNDGMIQKYAYANEDKNIIDFANKNNVKVMAVITNLPEIEGTTWDSKRVERVINNRAKREKHISDILTKLELLNFNGVNIDYEEVDSSQKDNFSLFIKELADALHKKGKIVAVSLHPDINTFQDWQLLAEYSDQLSIMAYNEHWDESDAGPIASYNWVKKIIENTQKLNIPPGKLFLGIPLYGYDWNKDNDRKARGLTFNDAKQLIADFDVEEKWDNNSRSPYFFYKDGGGDRHEVWFENSMSVKEKIQLAKQAGFKGITFWRLGGEDPTAWENWQF